MSIVNVEKILNGTPKKKLVIGFDKLKNNFTEEAALEYSNLYKNESLSFILENSNLIFSEPYFGLSFYRDVVCEQMETCAFTEYSNEYDKLSSYVESYKEGMPSEQLQLYESVILQLSDKISNNKNAICIASYVKENVDPNLEGTISELMYEFSKSNDDNTAAEIQSVFESVTNPVAYALYAPFINQRIMESSTFIESMTEDALAVSRGAEEDYDNGVKTIYSINKLMNDSCYKEAFGRMSNPNSRMIFEAYSDASINSILNGLTERRVEKIETFYSSPVMAVQSIFENAAEDEIDERMNEETKESIRTNQRNIYESILDIVTMEFATCNDANDVITGIDIFKEGTSIVDAVDYLVDKVSSLTTEAEEADDDEIEDIVNSHQSPDNKSSVKKPKSGSLSNKVQNKAMDLEAKQKKTSSILKKKGQDAINAAKAVKQLPTNVINSVKEQIKKVDELDDDRRKKYMSEPGFRKKAFRNLKLAIMYGTAAQVKLTLVPVTMVCRHYSKEKDRRMRNDLILKLQTEIKVCEEKISDASAAGDNAEKYRLIRIKDALDAEMKRVKTNSKYI